MPQISRFRTGRRRVVPLRVHAGTDERRGARQRVLGQRRTPAARRDGREAERGARAIVKRNVEAGRLQCPEFVRTTGFTGRAQRCASRQSATSSRCCCSARDRARGAADRVRQRRESAARALTTRRKEIAIRAALGAAQRGSRGSCSSRPSCSPRSAPRRLRARAGWARARARARARSRERRLRVRARYAVLGFTPARHCWPPRRRALAAHRAGRT